MDRWVVQHTRYCRCCRCCGDGLIIIIIVVIVVCTRMIRKRYSDEKTCGGRSSAGVRMGYHRPHNMKRDGRTVVAISPPTAVSQVYASQQ